MDLLEEQSGSLNPWLAKMPYFMKSYLFYVIRLYFLFTEQYKLQKEYKFHQIKTNFLFESDKEMTVLKTIENIVENFPPPPPPPPHRHENTHDTTTIALSFNKNNSIAFFLVKKCRGWLINT